MAKKRWSWKACKDFLTRFNRKGKKPYRRKFAKGHKKITANAPPRTLSAQEQKEIAQLKQIIKGFDRMFDDFYSNSK